MANTKSIHIEVEVPFDWTTTLTDEEAKVFCAWTLGPFHASVSYRPNSRYIPTENGGQCAMYTIVIEGTEAYRIGALAIMYDALRRQRFATVIEAAYCDLDDGGGWYSIPTVEEDKAAKQRAKEQVDQMMVGKKWVTRTLGAGITESRLEDESYELQEGER